MNDLEKKRFLERDGYENWGGIYPIDQDFNTAIPQYMYKYVDGIRRDVDFATMSSPL